MSRFGLVLLALLVPSLALGQAVVPPTGGGGGGYEDIADVIDDLETESVNVDSLGINLGSNPPGEALHLLDGNILFESANETGMRWYRSGAIGSETNPIFSCGRIVAAGVNLPVWRCMYQDSDTSEQVTFLIEGQSGTIASVCMGDDGNGCLGSGFEVFSVDGATEPTARLVNTYPRVGMEWGSGGRKVLAGQATCLANVVTFNTAVDHDFAVGQTFTLYPGEATMATSEAYTVASVTDGNTFTSNITCSGSNTVAQYVSGAPDTRLERIKPNTMVMDNGDSIGVTQDEAFFFDGTNANVRMYWDGSNLHLRGGSFGDVMICSTSGGDCRLPFGFRVGGSSVTSIGEINHQNATVDFASISNTCADSSTITLTGAAAADTCIVGVPYSMPTNSQFSCIITAADTAVVRHCAFGTADPPSGTFRVRHFGN